MNAMEKITKARAGLILDAPFFGSIALRHELVSDPTCETAWIDGRRLGFNPDFIDEQPLAKVKGLLAHEVLHVANCHHTRRHGRDNKTWQQATDYAINDHLTGAGFSLPDNGCTGYGTEKSAEQIYNDLRKNPNDDQGGDNGQNGNQAGGQDSGDSGNDGQAGADPGGCGEVRDATGADGNQASPAEMAQAEAETKVMVAQAAQQAKAMGKLPAGIARMVEELMQPVVDWREVLRQFVQQTARNDYRWNPPNRRFVYQNIYLPSARNEELGALVVAVDTSGSISKRHVDQFASELNAILEEYDTEAHVIYCDSRIANVEHFTSQDLPLELHPAGGGGTDFRPPFEWVDENGIDPACMIYLTDLCCSSYPDPPAYPVLWAQIGNWPAEAPPFGEVIEMN